MNRDRLLLAAPALACAGLLGFVGVEDMVARMGAVADGYAAYRGALAAGDEPAAQVSVQFVTETELFATSPTARRRRKQEQVSDVNALIKDLSETGHKVAQSNYFCTSTNARSWYLLLSQMKCVRVHQCR